MTRRSTAALLLGLAALAGAWLFGSRALAPVGLGLVAAAVVARTWYGWVSRHVAVARVVAHERPLEGTTVRIAYRVQGVGRVLLGVVRAREQLERLGELEARLPGGDGTLELRRAPRGRYAVVEAEVVLEDYLGLERVVVPAGPAQPVLVYPRLPELDGLFSDTARLGAGQRYLPLRASGFDFHSVREYEQGESLRKVHWPTTARRGRLMVKELRESPREDLVVLLQCDAAATVGPRGDSSFDAQVRAAGAFLRTVVARGRRAALVLGTQRMEMLRVTSLDGDWDAAFAALAGVEPDGDRPLERLLEDPVVERAGELVLVAGSLGPRAVEQLLMTGGRRRSSVVLVDAASYAGRPSGPHPQLLRLAAEGVPVAVIRRGDDLSSVLGAAQARSVSA